MNADGSGVKPLGGELSSLDLNQDLAENGGGLEWAPDGRILLWSASDEYGDVFAVDQDGSGLTQLTEGAELGTFAMSPDGTKFALHDQAKRLYVAPVEDDAEGEVTLMDETYGYVFDPWARVAWSPDGEAMAFSNDSMRLVLGSPLFVINADGTGLSCTTHGCSRARMPESERDRRFMVPERAAITPGPQRSAATQRPAPRQAACMGGRGPPPPRRASACHGTCSRP